MRVRRGVLVLAAVGCIAGLAVAPAPASGAGGAPRQVSPLLSLSGGVALAPDDVWAVGMSRAQTNVVRHWDGSHWRVVDVPSPCPHLNRLEGIDAVSTSDIWAVGACASETSYATIAVHWDGTGWTTVSTPNLSQEDQLTSVSAISPDDVWAVGWSVEDPFGGIVEHWNGHSWAMEPAPASQVTRVSALSDADVWAVTTDGLEHWDGSTWSSVPVLGARIADVEAVSSTDVWVVGSTIVGDTQGDFAAHWDGSSWSSQTMPHEFGVRHSLSEVAVVSGTDVWVTGAGRYHGAPSGYVLRFDGTTWTKVQRKTQPYGGFSAVLPLAPDDAWAIGDIGGFTTKVDAEHWNGAAWKRYALE